MTCVKLFRLRHFGSIVDRTTSREVEKPRSWAQGVVGSNPAAPTNHIKVHTGHIGNSSFRALCAPYQSAAGNLSGPATRHVSTRPRTDPRRSV